MDMQSLLLFVLFSCLVLCEGFSPSIAFSRGQRSAALLVVPPRTIADAGCHPHSFATCQNRQSSLLFLSSDDGDDSSTSRPKRRKKRVKRKTENVASPEEDTPSPTAPELQIREDSAVNLQVQDVRDLVGGVKATTASSSQSSASNAGSTSSSSSPAAGDGSGLDESLETMLKDAREMQALENKESSGAVGGAAEEEELTISGVVQKILSTIVTADFFVVCAFLLWFLAGIFCSYILKDDTVQIAFNQQFEAFVQPALGILMVGSIAGSFFENDEDEAV